MASPSPAPLGTWISPISSELITSKTITLGSPSYDPAGRLYWLEARPTEAGRTVLVSRDPASGAISDATPGPDSGLNVRTRVHEYGGGEYMVTSSGVFFSNFKDQRVYRQDAPTAGSPAGPPAPLTAEGLRFADYAWDGTHSRVVAVAEKHDPSDPSSSSKVENFVVAIDPKTGAVTTLVTGHDFFSFPRVSPDGKRMCWVCWDFPNMPWDGTQLVVADVQADGSVANARVPRMLRSIAGGPEESVQQPQWSPDGSRLYFISDRSGWWNIYSWDSDGKVEPLCAMAAEFGFPQWVFGYDTYHVFDGGHVLAQFGDPADVGVSLALISPGKGLVRLNTPFARFGTRLAVHVDSASGAVSIAAAAGGPLLHTQVSVLEGVKVEQLAASRAADWKLVKGSADLQLDPGFLSVPEAMAFPTDDGKEAHMLFYPPTNKDFVLPEGQLPPLMVLSHGGPTSSADVTLSLEIQYLTSRGFAVANVDYGGSTGYGREYRNRLRGTWGIVDVADCTNAALHLARAGRVDAKKLCIKGGSAGGFTTLACLAFRGSTFASGVSLYGVADLALLAKDTHKFESRYLDLLVGPYPEREDLYTARSPLAHVEGFKSPIIFFQGDEDAVVPPEQAIQMHAAVRSRGLPTSLVMLPGEQHGFRQARSKRLALDGAWYFLGKVVPFLPTTSGKVLGFPATMPEDLDAPAIDNLEPAA